VIVYSNSIYASLFEEEYCRLAARPHTGHFLTITTGAFAPVGPLLAPVVKHDFQMSWVKKFFRNISKKKRSKKSWLKQ
jgi:hypothetical protein